MLCLSMVVEHYVHGHVACMVWKQDPTRSPFGSLVVACAKLAADLGVLDRLDLRCCFQGCTDWQSMVKRLCHEDTVSAHTDVHTAGGHIDGDRW